MGFDIEQVKRVAELARIDISQEELEPLRQEMEGILQWIDMLQEVDTSNTTPMTSVSEMKLVEREDVVTAGNDPQAILMNAPNAEADYYLVPKVIE